MLVYDCLCGRLCFGGYVTLGLYDGFGCIWFLLVLLLVIYSFASSFVLKLLLSVFGFIGFVCWFCWGGLLRLRVFGLGGYFGCIFLFSRQFVCG